MQYKLKELYKQLNIPQVAWMGARMELPIQEFYVKLKLTSSNRVIHHHEMFKDKETKRILVEGLPGYGKTTLATKIAYDWAVNEEYTRRFRLVFLLTIRELGNKSVIDAIVDLIQISGFDKPKEVGKKIETLEKKILLILDGLDEVRSNEREKILKILYKREMKRMTVVITCRSGEFNLEPSEGRALFKGLPIKTEFCDQRVTVLGIQNEDKIEFLTKFLHEIKSVDKVIEYLKNVTDTTRELFDSPLILILLADMVVRGDQVGPTTTRTNFYKDVVNFMIRRSQERRNVFLSKSFNVFDAKNSENGSFKHKLHDFGHLCFKRVWDENQLEFDEDELIKNIHQLGLVNIHKKLSNVTFSNYYQIYHRTILEFMAAYYINQEFLHNNLVFPKLIEHKLFKDVYYYGKTSMVTPFLIGLMKENASHYFLMCSKYEDIFKYLQYTLLQILMECENLSQIQSALIPNLSSEIGLLDESFYSSQTYKRLSILGLQIYKRLITLGVQSGQIEDIHITWNDKINLPTDIELPNVHLEWCVSEVIEQMKQIKCQRLYWFTLYNEEVNKCLELLPQISAKTHIFNIRCNDNSSNKTIITFLKLMDNFPANVEIDRLFCNLKYLTAVEEMCDLLDKCQIHTLQLVVIGSPELNKILSHCKNVKHLELHECQISMDELFSNKRWETIELHDVELTNPVVKDFYVSKSVKLYNETAKCCAFISKICDISYLKCKNDTLFQLMTCSSWQGFQTITETVLTDPITKRNCGFWKKFHLFSDLKCLTIKERVQKEILENVLLLPVHTLTLDCPEYADMSHFSEDLSVVSRNVFVKSLKTLILRIPYRYSLTKDDVLRCVDILQYCSEKKMSLKNFQLDAGQVLDSIFEVDIVSNVDIKYSIVYYKRAFVSLSLR